MARSSQDRQSEILLMIKERGTVSIGDIASRFKVSEMTVRRVLYKLADVGLVIRTPGGAMVAPSGSMERTYLERVLTVAKEPEVAKAFLKFIASPEAAPLIRKSAMEPWS